MKYRCYACGRDKFDRPSPHNCKGGFRKQGLKFETVNANDFKTNNYQMKQYKLLKDIPGVKAGAIYSLEHNSPDIFFTPNSDNGLLISYLKKIPRLFRRSNRAGKAVYD